MALDQMARVAQGQRTSGGPARKPEITRFGG
jgi:hypothetical protein